MSCPYFKEGYFGICVAPEAIHVPGIAEMESFCFREHYELCPSFSDVRNIERAGMTYQTNEESKSGHQTTTHLHLAQ